VFDNSARIADQELASVTDNPAVSGTPEHPIVSSEAHAVAPALGQAADSGKRLATTHAPAGKVSAAFADQNKCDMGVVDEV
ncbi:hypothetical protein ACC732_36985, partial [Rhizobium ruizarguesonis]